LKSSLINEFVDLVDHRLQVLTGQNPSYTQNALVTKFSDLVLA
jgi:hypothetical protein